MPISRTHSGRLKAVLALVAAAGLTAAGLAFLSTPTEAAPSSGRPPQEGLRRRAGQPGAVHPDPARRQHHRVRRFGDPLSNGVATVKGNYTLVKGNDGYWRYAAGLTASGDAEASGVIAGQGAAPRAAKRPGSRPEGQGHPGRDPEGRHR